MHPTYMTAIRARVTNWEVGVKEVGFGVDLQLG